MLPTYATLGENVCSNPSMTRCQDTGPIQGSSQYEDKVYEFKEISLKCSKAVYPQGVTERLTRQLAVLSSSPCLAMD